MKEWVKMPSLWIRDERRLLATMRWYGADKSDQIAALMLYIVIVQNANDDITRDKQELGLCSLTYSALGDITGLSPTKISKGLRILYGLDVIAQVGEGRNNTYKVVNYGEKSGWAKLPARGLYNKSLSTISAFHKFNSRSKNELNALKLYLLVIALRDNSNNYATVSYTRISEYTGILRTDIRAAISLLINLRLIHIDSSSSDANDYSSVNMYRPCYLEPYKHRGTSDKGSINEA